MKKFMVFFMDRRFRWGKAYRRCNPCPSPSSSPSHSSKAEEIRETKRSKLCSWSCSLPKYLRRFSSQLEKTKGSYRRISQDSFGQQETTPKGYLPVYIVGEESEPKRRVLVPVIVFNHPLFVELMNRAAEEFGFDHQGGITIPCPCSDFDSVWTLVVGDNTRPNARRRKNLKFPKSYM